MVLKKKSSVITKTAFIPEVAECAEQSKASVARVLDCATEVLKKHLKKGDKISFNGITFQVGERKERMGVNPSNGQKIKIKASKYVKGKFGKAWKDAVN